MIVMKLWHTYADALLNQQFLYLLGIGAGEAVGDRYLSTVGLDNDVRKEQARLERDTADTAALDNRGGIADEACLVEYHFFVVYLQLVGKYHVAARDMAGRKLVGHSIIV